MNGCLATLANAFDSEAVTIDQTVGNAARITKLIGSVAVLVAADREEAVEQSPSSGFAFRMADETDAAQGRAQTREPAHPAVGLLGNPTGSDQRLKA